jgi:thiamine biosynthesis lipoprotein
MDTLVAIQVVRPPSEAACAERVARAFGWFRQVEAACSRFDLQSEVMALTRKVGTPVAVSPLLFEAVRVALAVARASRGAFDPTVGHSLERRGFNRNYLTGQTVDSGFPPGAGVSYRDVHLDSARQTLTLRRPLVLDLGAVAKGLAIDLAARELRPFAGFAVDAGGDLYLGGHNAEGESWRVGIPHPRHPGEILETLRVRDAAVCTSGDYERTAAGDAAAHHILDPRRDRSPSALASVTVVAPNAMLADALSTAAFVLGPELGPRFLERQGVEGLLLTPSLERLETPGFASYRA